MDDPQKTAPGDTDARVQKLVKRAENLTKQGMELKRLNLLPDYARMVIAAQEVVLYREQSLEETRRTVIAVAAGEHGIYEQDPSRAKTAYAAARKAQQAIHNSARGLALRLAQFEAVLNPRHQLLQVDVAIKFPLSSIMAAVQTLKDFAAATTPHPSNLAEVKFMKSDMSLTKEGHALQWWKLDIQEYREKWQDMYALARCWHLTDAKDIVGFQRVVRRLVPPDISEGRTWNVPCPPWAATKQRP